MSAEKQLAAALRAVLTCRGIDDTEQAQGETYRTIVSEALAAYDAWPERMATDYRVTTEWDALDADSPRAAAVEVWQRIRESAGPVFTVRCSDGRVLDVDLSDETDEGVEA